jgi:hypothetical protein
MPHGGRVSSNRSSTDPELTAMQGVADALAGLPDAAARIRVLRWALDRFAAGEEEIFGSADAPPPARSLTIVPARKPDIHADLEVCDLEDLFERRMNGDAEDGDVVDGTPAPLVSTEPVVEDTRRAANQPVASMIRGFVEDFRKLAREWDLG